MSIFKNFKNKFKIVIFHPDTYEEKFNFITSKFRITMIILVAVLLTICSTAALIVFTPIREIIPGYTDANLSRRVYLLERRADSMDVMLQQKDLYIENIKRIISLGELPNDSLNAALLINKGVKPKIKEDKKSERDRLFRQRFEKLHPNASDTTSNVEQQN